MLIQTENINQQIIIFHLILMNLIELQIIIMFMISRKIQIL